MSISLLSMNEERSEAILFSPSLIVTPHIIITSSGMPLEQQITDCLSATDYIVWLLLFNTIVILNLFYFVYQFINCKPSTIQIWAYIMILLNQCKNCLLF